VLNKDSTKLAKLVGHEGGVWGLTDECARLVSGSGDQTVRVWNLEELIHFKPEVDWAWLQKESMVFSTIPSFPLVSTKKFNPATFPGFILLFF